MASTRSGLLRQLPPHVSTPLYDYMDRHVLPQIPWMVEMLSGHLTRAVEMRRVVQPHANPTVAQIYAAMEASCDLGIGHPVYVARWVASGGKHGSG